MQNLPQAQANGFIGNITTQNANTVIDSGTTDVVVAETNLRSALTSSGVIGISSATGLQALANVVNGTNGEALDCAGKTIVLTQDVDLGSISNWTPIGTYYYDDVNEEEVMLSFSGNFNGNGHNVKNVKTSDTYMAGLFGMVSGTLSNIGVTDADISGMCSGALAAGVMGGSINNCYSTGNVSDTMEGDGCLAGGLIGYVSESIVSNSYTTCTVSAIGEGSTAGGFVGGVEGGNISNSGAYNNVTATGENSIAGGFVGGVEGGNISNSGAYNNVTATGENSIAGGFVGGVEGGNISNSGAYNNVTATGENSIAGGFVGEAFNSSTINNCEYYDSNLEAAGDNGGYSVTGVTLQNLPEPNPNQQTITNMPTASATGFITNITTQNATTIIDENINDIDVAVQNLKVALRTTGSVIGISSVIGLQALANVVNAPNEMAFNWADNTIVLTSDIDLSSVDNWTPIGTMASTDPHSATLYYFKGNFNGNGHTISNLNSSGYQTIGLFGYIDGGTISNTKVLNATVSGTEKIGGLVGYIEDGYVDNCCFNGYICGSDNAHGIGGLVGDTHFNSRISNSYVMGTVTAGDNSSCIGGLIGNARSVLNSFSTCNITVGNNSGTVGGLIGGLSGYNSNDISNSYSLGSISTGKSAREVGGLVGYLCGATVTSSFASGNVITDPTEMEGTASYDIGGLVGELYEATISASYANNSVIGNFYVGGLSGFIRDNSCIINSSYRGSVSGEHDIGGLVGHMYGESTINNSYSVGNVSGEHDIGGLVGFIYDSTIVSSTSYSTVNGTRMIGSFIGYCFNIVVENCQYTDSSHSANGNGPCNTSGITLVSTLPAFLTGGDSEEEPPQASLLSSPSPSQGQSLQMLSSPESSPETTQNSSNSGFSLQIGIDGSANSQISLNLGLDLSALNSILTTPSSASNITTLDNILSQITSVETQIGAGLNRLASVQESLLTQHKTLSSALSVVRDADVSQESARYIRSQILQQASASLLTVANQSPSLLLSLISGMTR